MYGIKIENPLAFIIGTLIGAIPYYLITGIISLNIPIFLLLLWLTAFIVPYYRYRRKSGKTRPLCSHALPMCNKNNKEA